MSRSRCRDGYTLIEMVAVLVMVLPLISLVGLMLRRSLVQYARAVDQAFEIHAVDQWTQRIRNEIHEANEAIISPDGSGLTLAISGNETIRYFQEGLGTSRQQYFDGRPLAIERSPWSSPLHFEKKESSGIPLIVVDSGVGVTIKTRLGSHFNTKDSSQ